MLLKTSRSASHSFVCIGGEEVLKVAVSDRLDSFGRRLGGGETDWTKHWSGGRGSWSSRDSPTLALPTVAIGIDPMRGPVAIPSRVRAWFGNARVEAPMSSMAGAVVMALVIIVVVVLAPPSQDGRVVIMGQAAEGHRWPRGSQRSSSERLSYATSGCQKACRGRWLDPSLASGMPSTAPRF